MNMAPQSPIETILSLAYGLIEQIMTLLRIFL